MDFYWHYSGKEAVDAHRKEYLCRAINVAKQFFNTLTEYIQDSTQIELLREFMKLQKEMFSMDQIKDLTTSEAFLEYDTNKDGFISPKDFYRAMEAQKG
ncbi:unnamed protein product, partial [Rotaria sp. Silwood2]